MNKPFYVDEEPVRVSGWVALGLGSILQAIILFAAGTPLLGIAGAIASMLLVSIRGLEWARDKVQPQWRADARVMRAGRN